MSSVRRESVSASVSSSSTRRRRCSSFCASAWSFQKSGWETRDSMRSSSVRERAGSKIAPQIGGTFHQILVAPYLLVENERHASSISNAGTPAGSARREHGHDQQRH